MEDKKLLNDKELENAAGGAYTHSCVRNACNYEASLERCLGCPQSVRVLPYPDGTALYKCNYGFPGYWNA